MLQLKDRQLLTTYTPYLKRLGRAHLKDKQGLLRAGLASALFLGKRKK